jgi:alpha-maltose-1-phosphate synthase
MRRGKAFFAAYQALWADLAKRGGREPVIAPRAPGAPAHPLRDDPFSVFSAYPSFVLSADCLAISLSGAGKSEIDRLRSIRISNYAEHIVAPAEEIRSLLSRFIRESPVPISALVGADTGPRRRALQLRSLGWLGKMGLVHFEPPATKSP